MDPIAPKIIGTVPSQSPSSSEIICSSPTNQFPSGTISSPIIDIIKLNTCRSQKSERKTVNQSNSLRLCDILSFRLFSNNKNARDPTIIV